LRNLVAPVEVVNVQGSEYFKRIQLAIVEARINLEAATTEAMPTQK
jgi:hypothetical protein